MVHSDLRPAGSLAARRFAWALHWHPPGHAPSCHLPSASPVRLPGVRLGVFAGWCDRDPQERRAPRPTATRVAAGRATLAVAALLAASSCRQPTGTLAVVKGHPVRVEDLRDAVEVQTGKPMSEAAPELLASLFETLLEEEVVLAAAGVSPSSEMTPAARTLRLREVIEKLCPPPETPSDQEVDTALARAAGSSPPGERLRLRQLILPDADAARVARERLRRGEDFAEVSRQVSRAANAANGGLLGWVGNGQLPPEFEAAVFGLTVGGYSEPVPSASGWHVFQVMKRRGAGSGPDPAQRERARAELAAQRAEVARRECVRRLASQVGVEVRCQGAPFPCHNPFEA